jgi:peptide chain release factor subunit 3
VLHTHTIESEVSVKKLISVMDKKGEYKRARFAKTGQMCYCRMQVPQTICIDTFAALPVLGRFTLRDEVCHDSYECCLLS